MNNDDIPVDEPEKVSEPKVLKDEEIPEHVKRIIDRQSTIIEQQSKVIESNQRELISQKTDVQDLRNGLGPLLELAERIKKAQQEEQQQQGSNQQTTQQSQNAGDGLPLNNQTMVLLAKSIEAAVPSIVQGIVKVLSGTQEQNTSAILDTNTINQKINEMILDEIDLGHLIVTSVKTALKTKTTKMAIGTAMDAISHEGIG